MNFFGKRKKEESKPLSYVSNVNVNQLGLMEQLDRTVAVICDGQTVAIDRAIHVCITEDAISSKLENLKKKDHKDYNFMKMPLGMALDNVIQQDLYDALILYGLLPVKVIITKEDLQPLRDLVDSYCIMSATVRKAIDLTKAYELMAPKKVFILGTLPFGGMKQGDTFGYEVIKRKSETGDEYEAVKCFLTKESAEKFNGSKSEITEVMVGELVRFVGTVIIEPHRNYWIEFRNVA